MCIYHIYIYIIFRSYIKSHTHIYIYISYKNISYITYQISHIKNHISQIMYHISYHITYTHIYIYTHIISYHISYTTIFSMWYPNLLPSKYARPSPLFGHQGHCGRGRGRRPRSTSWVWCSHLRFGMDWLIDIEKMTHEIYWNMNTLW